MRSVTSRNLVLRIRFAPGLLLAAAMFGGGCYKHVVRVTGPGSSAYDVHEPNIRSADEERRLADAAAKQKAAEQKAKEQAKALEKEREREKEKD